MNNWKTHFYSLIIFLMMGSAIVIGGTSTLTVLDSTGATKTYFVVTNGSSQMLSAHVLCDQSAGANCATVDASHNLAVKDTNSDALLIAAQAGTATNGASYPGSSVAIGGDGLSAEPTVVTTGQLVPAMRDLVGKSVSSPYAPRELMLRGTASSTSNTAVDLIAAQGASVKIYVTNVECGRTERRDKCNYCPHQRRHANHAGDSRAAEQWWRRRQQRHVPSSTRHCREQEGPVHPRNFDHHRLLQRASLQGILSHEASICNSRYSCGTFVLARARTEYYRWRRHW